MAIKFKTIIYLLFSLVLISLYFIFFTPQIKPIKVSQPITLEALLNNN